MKLTHSDLERQVLDLLHACGVWAFLTHKARAYHHRPIHRGISDIIGIYGGKFLAVEIKVGKDKVDLRQIEFSEAVKAHGGLWVEVRCAEDLVRELGLRVLL